jgi:hypothetical protein
MQLSCASSRSRCMLCRLSSPFASTPDVKSASYICQIHCKILLLSSSRCYITSEIMFAVPELGCESLCPADVILEDGRMKLCWELGTSQRVTDEGWRSRQCNFLDCRVRTVRSEFNLSCSARFRSQSNRTAGRCMKRRDRGSGGDLGRNL